MSIFMSVEELRAIRTGRAQPVDVRSESEFATGHIPTAVNIPMDQIEARLDDLNASTPLVLICQAGKRAEMTAGLPEPCGREIRMLEGGTNARMEAGQRSSETLKPGGRWSGKCGWEWEYSR